jgi:regulator of cell morphogenesis and NO signaling
MFLVQGFIKKESAVSDIVFRDYRTAAVFRKYDISYCCGGKWPLEAACLMKGIDPATLTEELHKAVRVVQLHPSLPFEKWNTDFLIDYIVNIHHHYLRHTIPEFWPVLNDFTNKHLKNNPRLFQLQANFRKLRTEMFPHLDEEETIVFPYIKQLSHAYEDKDPYAQLLVKTMRKPIDHVMANEHRDTIRILDSFRDLTDNYTLPGNACTSHHVVFQKLKEIDHELAQHMYLENNILFPRALAMEKQLLQKGA